MALLRVTKGAQSKAFISRRGDTEALRPSTPAVRFGRREASDCPKDSTGGIRHRAVLRVRAAPHVARGELTIWVL